MKTRRALLFSIIAVLALCAAWVMYYGLVTMHVKTLYVVHKGYRGKLSIKQNQSDGQEVPMENGAYVFRIPKEGLLKIKGADPALNRNESTSALYDDGTPLSSTAPEDIKPNVVAFFFVRTYTDGTSEFFVGTKEELDRTYYQ